MAIKQQHLPFAIPSVLPQRRIACGFSALLVAVAALATLALVIGFFAGFIFLIKTQISFRVGLFVCVFGFCLYQLGRAIHGMVAEGRKRKRNRAQREAALGMREPSPGIGERLAGFGRGLAVALSLIGLESLLIYGWARYSKLVLTDFWDASLVNPDGVVAGLILGLFIQASTTLVAWGIWCGIDRRVSPNKRTRLLMTFFMMMFPLWGIKLGVILLPFVQQGGAALIGWAGAAPLVGVVLGAAYSCEENIFDKLKLRS